MHKDMFDKAQKFLDSQIVKVKDWSSSVKTIKDRKIVKTVWCGEEECEDLIKDKTGGASSRCIIEEKVSGKCPQCGKDAKVMIYFSKSY